MTFDVSNKHIIFKKMIMRYTYVLIDYFVYLFSEPYIVYQGGGGIFTHTVDFLFTDQFWYDDVIRVNSQNHKKLPSDPYDAIDFLNFTHFTN